MQKSGDAQSWNDVNEYGSSRIVAQGLFSGSFRREMAQTGPSRAFGIIHTEIRRTSGIVITHPKGAGYALYPFRCRPVQAPHPVLIVASKRFESGD
jgi:hypothetical protein